MVTSPTRPMAPDLPLFARLSARDPAHAQEDGLASRRKGPGCPTSPRCSSAAASGAPRPADGVRRLPPHPAGGRAPARAGLGQRALRPLLRRAARRAPRGGALRARARERAPARPSCREAAWREPARSVECARAVRQVTVSTVISAPREEVFDFVLRPRRPAGLHRPLPAATTGSRACNPVGVGRRRALPAEGAAREASTPSCTITEVDRPRRIVEELAGRPARAQPLGGGVRLHRGSRPASPAWS